MKAEDKFYFGKPGQPERFANAAWMPEVNRMLSDLRRERAKIKIWISGSDSVTAAGSSIGTSGRWMGTTWIVAGRIANYLKFGVPGAALKHEEKSNYPKKGMTTSFYTVSNLPKELIAYLKNWGISTTPQSFSGFTGTSAVAYARPGHPERFDMEGACWEGYEPVGTKQKDGKTVPNCVPMKNAAGGQEKFSGVDTIAAYVQVLYEEFGTARGKQAAQEMMRAAQSIGGNAGAALQKAIRTASTSKNVSDRNRAIGDIEDYLMREGFSRPGQPEKFDASSLDRGSFAEASQSPMLGKLLAARVMPEGGWRAVQAGSDTLVISFEDADLARDFGRRVATKGYNATSPVQSIGRYWNVEVKNGK